jgi:small subunit ribosomal protein S20
MANHKSSEKRIRTTTRVTAVANARKNRIRTFVRKIEQACAAGDAAAAEAAFKAARPEIMRGVAKGVLNKNAAARKVSRLSARIKSLKG